MIERNESVPVGWFEREARRLASLSMSHNSDEAVAAKPDCDSVAGTPNLPFKLSGSQRKTAYALEINVATLIEAAGIESVGFLTLTIGDTDGTGTFRQVFDSDEASRRIDSLRRGLLSDLFSRAVIVTERHKSGAIHFHVIGALRSGADIRTGYDHEAAARGDYSRASAHLRGVWAMLRERLPGYGFGRAELTPLKSTGEAVSRYVSKYVEKNLFNRLKADKGKKLVRYHGWQGRQMKPNGFSWATPRAVEWRQNARTLAATQGITRREDVAKCFGPRWAFRLTRAMHAGEEASALDAFAWRQHVMRWTRFEVVHIEWNRWDSEDAWEEYVAELEASKPPTPDPEPCWEQLDFLRAA